MKEKIVQVTGVGHVVGPKGFDCSAVMGARKMQVWVKFNDQMRVQVNYVSREEFTRLVAEATDTSWDRKHQKTEVFNDGEFSALLGSLAVNDWDGPLDGPEGTGAPIPCTPENVERFMRNWIDFAKFVASICTDLERLVAEEKATLLKK